MQVSNPSTAAYDKPSHVNVWCRHPLLLEASARVKEGYKPTSNGGLSYRQPWVGKSTLQKEVTPSCVDDDVDTLTSSMESLKVVNQDMSPPRFLRAPSEYNTGGLSAMYDADAGDGFESPEHAIDVSGSNASRIGSAARIYRGQLFDVLGRLPDLSEIFAV